MKINRNFFLRNLKISNNYLEFLARENNIKLGHFIDKADLDVICNYLSDSQKKGTRKLILKSRIENFLSNLGGQDD